MTWGLLVQNDAPVNGDGAEIRTAIGARLRSERERLRLSQTDFARLAKASKRSQIAWEQGESTPNAEALAYWAAHGLDVVLVLTGTPGAAPLPLLHPELSDRSRPFEPTPRAAAELKLLGQLRQLDEDDFAAIRRLVDRLPKPAR